MPHPVLPATFETSRLVARLPVPDDAATLFARYTQRLDVGRYMTWRPHRALVETEAFVADCIAAAAAGPRRPYVLCPRDDVSHPIGQLDARPTSHVVDVGYVLAPDRWGQGLMPEALRALASIALRTPECFRVQAVCDVDNLPSQRTLEKAGFVREGRHERLLVHPDLSPEPRPCHQYAVVR